MSLRTTERGLVALAYPQQPYHLMKYGAVEYGSAVGAVALIGSTVAGVITGRKTAKAQEDVARQQAMMTERAQISDTLYAQQQSAANTQLAKFAIPALLLGGLAAIVILRDKKK